MESFDFIITRHKEMITDFKGFWLKHEMETQPPKWHFINFGLPWVVLSIGLGFFMQGFNYYPAKAFLLALSEAGTTLAVLFAGAFVLEKLSDSYAPTSQETFQIILTYAAIPIFAAQALSGFFSLISVFSLVVLWHGYEAKVPVDPNKKVGFFILSAIILLLLKAIAKAMLIQLFGLQPPSFEF